MKPFYKKLIVLFSCIFVFSIIYSFFDNSKFEGWTKEDDDHGVFDFQDYQNRLFYSVLIQSTLGFGAVYPKNKLLQFVTMVQVVITCIIAIY